MDLKYEYFKFAKSIFLLFILIILFDQICGSLLRKYYFSQTSGLGYRTTYSIDSTQAEILVLGSSRANHHYVPEVFEDSLDMSFYNTGRDGNFILFNYALLKSILKRYTPKIIILDINPNEIFLNQDRYDRLSSLLPYYKDHHEIRDIVQLRSPYEKLKLISAIYPFNSSLFTIGIGNFEYNKTRKGDRKGYVPLYKKLNDTTLITLKQIDLPIDSIKLKVINSIAELCKDKNISLFFINSPVYARSEQSRSINIIEQILQKFNAKLVNYTNDSFFLNNPSLFQDISHLNEKGAAIFSGKVVHLIKNQISKTSISFSEE
jgi:hypothetical protein